MNGTEIELLGHSICTTGVGRIHAQEAKRLGVRADIQRLLTTPNGNVAKKDVDELTGRCSFLAQVVSEGNAYPQPMYRLRHQKWAVLDKKSGTKRVREPTTISINGNGPVQAA